jgi:two-component system, chemotaxis family, response regulator Rcp1
MQPLPTAPLPPLEPVEILLVEDHPGDVRLTREALQDSKVWNRLRVATTGFEALAILRRQPGYEAAPRPDLILLDLHLPGLSGVEVLDAVREDPELSSIPVVVVTASRADRERVLRLGANAYITKPVDVRQLAQVVGAVADLWLTIVKLEPDLVSS